MQGTTAGENRALQKAIIEIYYDFLFSVNHKNQRPSASKNYFSC